MIGKALAPVPKMVAVIKSSEKDTCKLKSFGKEIGMMCSLATASFSLLSHCRKNNIQNEILDGASLLMEYAVRLN